MWLTMSSEVSREVSTLNLRMHSLDGIALLVAVNNSMVSLSFFHPFGSNAEKVSVMSKNRRLLAPLNYF